MSYKKHYQSALVALILYQIAIIIDDRPSWVIVLNLIALSINLYNLTRTFE